MEQKIAEQIKTGKGIRKERDILDGNQDRTEIIEKTHQSEDRCYPNSDTRGDQNYENKTSSGIRGGGEREGRRVD